MEQLQAACASGFTTFGVSWFVAVRFRVQGLFLFEFWGQGLGLRFRVQGLGYGEGRRLRAGLEFRSLGFGF